MQKNGAGLNSSASMHWDTAKDGFCKVPWQNSTMHCIVSVFGLSINIDDPQDDMMYIGVWWVGRGCWCKNKNMDGLIFTSPYFLTCIQIYWIRVYILLDQAINLCDMYE